MAAASPTRTCVGCRGRDEQRALLRLVLVDGVVVDGDRPRRPGRGAYVHRDRDCLEAALRRGAFNRAFRARVLLDPGVEAVIAARDAADASRLE